MKPSKLEDNKTGLTFKPNKNCETQSQSVLQEVVSGDDDCCMRCQQIGLDCDWIIHGRSRVSLLDYVIYIVNML